MISNDGNAKTTDALLSIVRRVIGSRFIFILQVSAGIRGS